MRPDLTALRAAGVQRARFSAVYCGRGPRGHVILRDVAGPVGLLEHAWVRPDHWWGRMHQKGDRVAFVGSVEPDGRDDGSMELGLFRCREVAP